MINVTINKSPGAAQNNTMVAEHCRERESYRSVKLRAVIYRIRTGPTQWRTI